VFDGYATNCITEIPQDIKLELNNGTLTLKAGSKVYVPNGFEADGVTKKFDVVVVESDITISGAGTGVVNNFLFYRNSTTLDYKQILNCNSGTSDSQSNATAYYDTTQNKLHCYTANGAKTQDSFPLCSFTVTSGTVTSIDQVFNGFGYIGSTVFALPNVKGLIPNGRNADGSLRNIELTVSKVSTMIYAAAADNICANINSSSALSTASTLIESETEPSGSYILWYKPSENLLRWKGTGSFGITKSIQFASFSSTATNITTLNPKLPFHAVDRNDSSWIAGQAMPSSKYINLTLGASGSTYTAPANGWFFISKKISTNQYFIFNNVTKNYSTITAPSGNNTIVNIFPCQKGDVIEVDYTASGSIYAFKFIYAEGDK
jgi:hypothetical protein